MVSKALVLLNVFTFCSVVSANIDRKKVQRAKRGWEQEIQIEKVLTEESKLKVHPDCEVEIDGVKATLDDLKEGMEITFTISEENLVVKIVAKTVVPKPLPKGKGR